MKCFYHSSDLDGLCSAAIVKHRHPECKLFGINYGKEFPWDSITPGETVYMVDFSLPWIDMVKLDDRCNLVLIDHHKTFIDKMRKHSKTFKGLQEIGIGACALVWDYLFPIEPIPYFIQLLAKWDVWDHTDRNCKPFQYGMRLETRDPEDGVWEALFYDHHKTNFLRILDQGQIVVKYEQQSNTMKVKAAAFETELEGLKCIACNQMMTNSTLFDSIWDEDKYDAMIAFGWRNGRWVVSLYATKVDVGIIAVSFGGGGHAHSCGFTCDELPFELK